MTTATKLKLTRQQLREVERLCAEFDPGQHIPEWISDRGASEDWAAYIRVDRYDLRGLLEVAVLLGKALKQLDTAVRLEVFYAASDELTKGRWADEEDWETRRRLDDNLTLDEDKFLRDIIHEASTAPAVRRALSIDDPQVVISP